MSARFIDRVGWEPTNSRFVEPTIWRKEEIESEIARLFEAPGGTGRRSVRLAHDQTGSEGGLTQVVGVSISVLEAGESTPAHKHTHSIINWIREGHGHSVIGGRRIDWGPGDFFTTPEWLPHQHTAAEDSEPVVRFSFSDGPLHEKIDMLFYEDVGVEEVTPFDGEPEDEEGPGLPSGLVLGPDGAQLLTYKHLLKPKAERFQALAWPADQIKAPLDEMDDQNPEYHGRRVVMLYDPVTGTAQGTTSTLTAFAGIIVAGEVHPPHRHTSSAINYWTQGSGYSVIDGNRLDWEAGDLVLSPGWATHGHANDGDETAWGIVVHDAPLLFRTGPLMWQEGLDEDVEVLGRKPTPAVSKA